LYSEVDHVQFQAPHRAVNHSQAGVTSKGLSKCAGSPLAAGAPNSTSVKLAPDQHIFDIYYVGMRGFATIRTKSQLLVP
jgi:hypothetical protein